MKIICWILLLAAPTVADTAGVKRKVAKAKPQVAVSAEPTADADAARLQGFSKGAQLVKPKGNPNTCSTQGAAYSKDDAGYAACVRAQEAMQPAFGGKNPNNANPADVLKVNPSSQNGFR